MITLNQLRIFWAVAHSESLTRAAKQLGVTQPSLSQQLAKLEAALGGRLFDRVNNQLVLTDAGRFLLRKAEVVLAELDEAEAGLAEFKMGRRSRIAIGALASIARTLVPAAHRETLAEFPELELDLHELAPSEALEQLYGRNIQMALVSAFSLAPNGISFSRFDIARDSYVLATPKGLDLGCVVGGCAPALGRAAHEAEPREHRERGPEHEQHLHRPRGRRRRRSSSARARSRACSPAGSRNGNASRARRSATSSSRTRCAARFWRTRRWRAGSTATTTRSGPCCARRWS